MNVDFLISGLICGVGLTLTVQGYGAGPILMIVGILIALFTPKGPKQNE